MNATILLYMYEKTEMISYKNIYIQSYVVRIISYKESNDLRIIILENIYFKYRFFFNISCIKLFLIIILFLGNFFQMTRKEFNVDLVQCVSIIFYSIYLSVYLFIYIYLSNDILKFIFIFYFVFNLL